MEFGTAILLVTAIVGTLSEENGEAIRVQNIQELQKAIHNADSGDTILLEDGTYGLESSLWIENKENLTIKGASEDPEKVILMGGGWDGGKPRDVMVIRGSGNIAISYLTITEARSYGIKIEGVEGLRNPWDINISYCRFIDIGVRAVKGTATQDRKHMERGSVRHCYFENTRVPDSDWLFNGNYISSIDMMYLDHWTFADNVFKNIKGANGGGRGAIFVWNQSRNVVVERNLFMNCDRSIAFGNPSEPTNYVQGTLHNYDGIIRNNAILVGADKGIELVWLDNVKVYNNTIYCTNPRTRGIHYFQKINRLHLANNLVHGRMEGEGDVISENNLVGDLTDYFVDPEAGDFRLTEAASLARGKGAALEDTMKVATTILMAQPENPQARPTAGFRITYRWQAVPMDRNYGVFVHFIDKDGKIVLQDDHKPPTPTSVWSGLVEYTRTVPLPVWQPKDKRTIDVTLPEGEYSIHAGLYDKQEGRKHLDAGPGVAIIDGEAYKIGTLIVNTKSPIPEVGERTLDLTGYHLTFDEEFDDLSVSAWGPCGTGGTRWIAHTPWKGDFGDARFTDPGPDFPFTIQDGMLRIEARKADGKWRSGLLSAVDPDGNGFKQKYGYFECRAKFPKGPGTWPAFWLMGTLSLKGNTGPRVNPEVDVFEYYGHWPNRFCYVLHQWGLDGAESKHDDEKRIVVFGMDEDFHDYGMMIDEDNMVLYFDGVEMHRQKTPEAVKVPLFPLVNLALGPGWPIDKTPNPSYMYVDYVKVYSK